MERAILPEHLSKYSDRFHSSRENLVAMNAVTANGVKAAARSYEASRNKAHQYSLRLKTKGTAAPKSGGYGWVHAAMSCLRFKVIEQFGLEELELSQNYILFYDKLEKSNYFLENILNTLDEDIEGRLMTHLLSAPFSNSGQWAMVSALITKYGVVPKEAMPDTSCTLAPGEMDSLITEKLRGFAADLREKYRTGSSMDALRAEKRVMLATVYRMLCICLGTPPDRFDFQGRTKKDAFLCDRGLTPKRFYDKYVGVDLSQYISLIHAPTADKPYMHSYTVPYLGNVVGGAPVKYVNLEIETLKTAALAQLQDGEPVWFGCDVGRMGLRDENAMDLDAFDYANLFGTKFDMDKTERLDYGISKLNQAMVFQGVDLDENGDPVRWCVENNWSPGAGKKGVYLMTDDWFREYVYQVVVNRKYLPACVIKAYEEAPVVLQPWDPIGALA